MHSSANSFLLLSATRMPSCKEYYRPYQRLNTTSIHENGAYFQNHVSKTLVSACVKNDAVDEM